MLTGIVIILYNLLDGIMISFGGQLKLNEVLVLLVLPLLYRSMEFSRYPMLKKIVVTLIALLFFQIITDLFAVDTSVKNYIRGWSQIIISIVSVVFLFKILNSYQALALFILMIAIKRILFAPMLQSNLLDDSDMQFFKWRVFPVVSYLIFFITIFLHHWGKRKVIPVIFILYGLFSISMDSRSNGLVFFLSGLLLFSLYSGFKWTWKRVGTLSIVMLIVFQGLYVLYVNSILTGRFGGDHAKAQIERLANPYNPISLLQSGRGETFAALVAIGDKPIFGHGSWAVDKTLKYYHIVQQYHDNEKKHIPIQGTPLVPSHSVILGAWVNHGFGAFVCTLFLLFYVIKMGLFLLKNAQSAPIYPIVVPLLINFVWAFLFSPFQYLRFGFPMDACIFLTSYYLTLKRMKEEEIELRNEIEFSDEAEPSLSFPNTY